MWPSATTTMRNLASTHGYLQCSLLLTGSFGLDSTADQFNLGYSNNTCQRFASEAECMQATQVFHALDFAGGMALAHMLQFVFGYTISIIGDANQVQAATTQFDTNVMCTCIQR